MNRYREPLIDARGGHCGFWTCYKRVIVTLLGVPE